MFKLQTKEHLVHFMSSGMMKLSNYDQYFVQNIQYIIHQRQAITTNQNLLLNKLIEKYKKQFSKHKLTVEFLNKLDWSSATVIESSPEFTEAHITIEDGRFCLKCPFNKKFINELRNYESSPLGWDPLEKRYKAEVSTLALKIMYNVVPKHYNKVNYSKEVIELLNNISPYNSSDIWTPTLVKSNGRLYIGATNPYLDEAIKDIELNLDMKTLSKLSEYGVELSDKLSNDEKSKFASSVYYETQLSELNTVIDWLKELGCDCVFFSGVSNQSTVKELDTKLNELSIANYKHSDLLFAKNKILRSQYEYIVSINFSVVMPKMQSWLTYRDNIKKVIKVNNSYPITIK